VAVQRGGWPASVLSEEELAAVRDATAAPARIRPQMPDVSHRPELLVLAGVSVALVGLGIEVREVSIVGAAAALAAVPHWAVTRLRSAQLGRALDAALRRLGGNDALFFGVADAFSTAWRQDFALLVTWSEGGSDGTVELTRGDYAVPHAELMSWLLRGAESDRELIVDDGSELGGACFTLALPLRRENSALVGFLVLGSKEHPPAHLLAAARARVHRIGVALADAPERGDELPTLTAVGS